MTKIVKIKKQIERLKQEELSIVESCKFSAEAVQESHEKLNLRRARRRELEAEYDNALDRILNRRAIPADQTPSRVELMEAWCYLFMMTFVVTWICSAISFTMQEQSSTIYTGIGIGFGLGLAWSPGLVVIMIFEFAKERLAKHHPLYASPRSLVYDSFNRSRERLNQLSGPNEWVRDISFGLCGFILVGDIACFYLADFICLSLILGLILSAGGLLIICGILLLDAAKVAFWECKLRIIIYCGLRQVF